MRVKLPDSLWISRSDIRTILRLWKSLKLSRSIAPVLHRVMKGQPPPPIRPKGTYKQIHSPYYECY